MWRRLGSGMVGPLFLLSPGLPRLSQFDRRRREGTDGEREIGRKEKGGRKEGKGGSKVGTRQSLSAE